MRNLRPNHALFVLSGLAAGGVAGWLLLASLSLDPGSRDSPSGPPPSSPSSASLVSIPGVRFTDITKEAGIRLTHTNGAFGKKLLPETMGPGVAFLDYDGDGWQDILFINSCWWPGYEE